ncbi:TetR/AcrR family transcriptional regulator C-terminal domain-containing protein [Amycolatopsis sp. NPDC005232]|uniref:TetR/AcrR family transcriptional regulator n=1 Tax=Amycolatopsis sp. NPDC005232 TaxID=3157027 RepID=UPI0033BEEC40
MTAPRSRRERPAKPALTRAGIITAALAILRAEGLSRLTMRRLAQELDTGAASLYVYVRNTVELHAAVLDELLGEVEPAPSAGTWAERLEAVLGSYTAVLFRYPGLAQSALVARPRGDNYLRLVDTVLALLGEGGVPSAQAAWGVDLLLQLATATAAEHADERPEDREEWRALAAVIHDASPEKYPHLAAAGSDLLSGEPGQRLSWAFRALIAGIAATPRT